MPLEENSCYNLLDKDRIYQGNIIRNLNITFSSKLGDEDFELQPSFSYGVVLTQECDLEQHYNQCKENELLEIDNQKHDKVLDVVLICPAFASENFMQGNHINGQKMNDFQNATSRKSAFDKIKKNDAYNRYHFLPEIEGILPDLIIDFKRFYTVPIKIFEANIENTYVVSIKDLFKDRLSQRFTNYLARIGLPENRDF